MSLDGFHLTLEKVCTPLADRAAALRKSRRGTVIVGLCGPQGSGKSTIGAAVVELLQAKGLTAVAISLDDFYLPRSARERLAAQVHPLLATRGPPGTHDLGLATATLHQLRSRGRVSLPAFDKATDDRAPRAAWRTVATPVDVVLFEGWCLGAKAQGSAALARPVNALEAEEDPDGRWRTYINDQLDGPYQELFARVDLLALLQPPGFEGVADWRLEQEHKLIARTGAGMSDAAVGRFVLHYERLTRWILAEMPDRADVVFALGADRAPV